MSILMFSSTGLVPISQAISGAVSKWNLTLLFASAGELVLLVTLWTAFQPALTTFSENLTAAPSEVRCRISSNLKDWRTNTCFSSSKRAATQKWYKNFKQRQSR